MNEGGPNRILDDMARLMNDAAGVAQGVRREAETALKAQAERIAGEMDLVKRDDFDAVKDMAVMSLDRVDALEERISALEKAISALKTGPAASSDQQAES